MELMTAVGVGVLVRPGAEDAQLFLPSPPMGDGGSCEPVVERGIVVNFPLGCVTERFATREIEERTGRRGGLLARHLLLKSPAEGQ